jgi:hypothetical protein
MFTGATAVTDYTMFIPQFLPQNNAALLGVVSLNKSKKVHNQKQLECSCNIHYSPLDAKPYGTLQHNLMREFTLINV